MSKRLFTAAINQTAVYKGQKVYILDMCGICIDNFFVLSDIISRESCLDSQILQVFRMLHSSMHFMNDTWFTFETPCKIVGTAF